jgi:hypothetical protein
MSAAAPVRDVRKTKRRSWELAPRSKVPTSSGKSASPATSVRTAMGATAAPATAVSARARV